MTSPNLKNLVKTGQLKREPGDQREFDGLVRSARARLADARKHALSIESRFDLAYNSAHALGLAALRSDPPQTLPIFATRIHFQPRRRTS
jgi:hypothetical protein